MDGALEKNVVQARFPGSEQFQSKPISRGIEFSHV